MPLDDPTPASPRLRATPDPTDLAARVARSLADGRDHCVPDLAARLDATDDDIERAVLALRSHGMRLDLAHGLVRAAPFVPLDGRALQAAVDKADPARRWTTRVATTTPSTNATLLRELRHDDAATPAILATDFQSDGRGRRGRAWRSAPGASLTVSFGLACTRDLAALAGVTLACGLAVRGVVDAFGIDARLKWPNDVVVDGRKLAGILVESLRTTRTVLVVGIGLNVSALEGDEASARTDLATCGVVDCDRHRLVAALATALASRVDAIDRAGFASMAPEYCEADAFRDRRVAVSRGDGEVTTGIERGVDARGALCVETDGGRVSFVAGDVSLRLA